MNILTLGCDSFINKNLLSYTIRNNDLKIFNYTSLNQFRKYLSQINFIIICSKKNKDKKKNCLNFIQEITKEIKKKKNLIPIIFLSDYSQKNYLNLKLSQDENNLLDLHKLNKNPITIIRLPMIFGKFFKKNYSPLMDIISQKNIDKNINLLEKIRKEKIVYIEDLIKLIIKEIYFLKKGFKIRFPKPIYSYSLKDIYNKIFLYDQNFSTTKSFNVGSGFERALYSSFLSYKSPKNFKKKINSHQDQRGEFFELLKTKNSGQFSFFTIEPNKTRGQHYHNTKFEKFLVVNGKVEFKFKHILKKKIFKILCNEKKMEIVNSIPGWIHSLKNIGKRKAQVFVWSNEVFNVKKPDTIFKKIK